MTDQLKQKIEEEIVKLPKIKQDAINSVVWYEIIEEIGKKNLLSDDEINVLQLETGLALLGLVSLDLYSKNVEENIGLDNKSTKKIINDVFEKLFVPIAKKIEFSIKNNMSTIIPDWKQTINFIISGGDYSVFLEK